MASKIDVSNLTLNDEEVSEVGKVVLEKEFVNGVLSEDHDIQTGIEHDQQIVFAGKIEDSLTPSTGCTPSEGGTLGFTEKKWSPKIYDTRFTHCASEVNKLLKIFKKAKRVNPDFYNRIESEEMALVAARVGMMLREVLPKKLWFSDTAAAEHGSGGRFATGTNLDLYNGIDGFWKQIYAEIPAGNALHVNISANEGVDYSGQALADDATYETFEAMLEKADERLLEDPAGKFMCTRSMADNYRKTLRNKTLGAGFIEVVENGKPKLYFDGYPISIRYDWDRGIKLEDNGTVLNLPHRALFTTPDNIPIGTLSEDDFQELDSFYDRTLKSNIIDVALSLDAKFLEPYMAVAAY